MTRAFIASWLVFALGSAAAAPLAMASSEPGPEIIRQALAKGLTSIEPSEAAQEAWVKEIRATAIDISSLQLECPPSYFNNDGDTSKKRWYLGESYGPGWAAFEKLVADWRDAGNLTGLIQAKTELA